MFMRKMIVAMFVAVLATMSTIWGAEYWVDPNGVDDPNGGDPNNPFRTIKYAIGRCSDVNDDIIYIQDDPNEPNDYIEEPMLLKSNLHLDFNQGVVVEAESGAFPNDDDCLFEAQGKSNIIFEGYGTIFRMRRSEYPPDDEHRHIIYLRSCSDVNIMGLTLKDSGGDGICVGRHDVNEPCCENILIEDVISDNSYRNGISVISANDLTIQNCVLKNTNGTAPMAGIDFEPSKPWHQLTQIHLRNTRIENNEKKGIDLALLKLWAEDPNELEDLDIILEDVNVTGKGGIIVYGPSQSGPLGSIEFRNVTVEDVNYGLTICKSSLRAGLSFVNCTWKNIDANATDPYGNEVCPISVYNSYGGDKPVGVEFIDCQVFDDVNRPAINNAPHDIGGRHFPKVAELYEIHGDIYVHNPNLAPDKLYDWGDAELYHVDLMLHSDDVNVGYCKAHNETNHHCYPSIQSAINDANEFDVINVLGDTHYETIDFNGLSITVTSRDPENDDVVVNTIIDANSASRVVTFDSGEDANSVLTGFTITGGYAPGTGIDRDGGGIFCYGSSPTISRCVIYDNYAGDDGGGIFCDSGSDPEIYACSISYNDSGDKGGAMYCRNSDPTVKDCDILSNNANEGGGIYCSSSEPQIENCIVSENQTIGTGISPDGGGICCLSSSPNILSCIINDNFSDDDGGGIWCDNGSDPNIINCTLTQNEADDKGGGIYCRNSDPVITNCILWDDTASTGNEIHTSSSTPFVSYSDVEGGWSGAYNINSDPCFMNPDANDFHLDSDSPCINVGDPNGDYTSQTDIDGDPRVIGSIVDMGSDESPYRVYNITRNKWYASIQGAIDDALANDEIMVYPGTFYESVEIDVNSIILRGTDPNDWTTVADTIVDANNATYGIKYTSYLDSTLAGLTIRNASYYGIQCFGYSSPTIKNCIVEENDYGLIAFLSDATIINSKIRQNTYSGIHVLGAIAQQIKNNWIYDNARGIYLAGSSADKVIRNNTIVGNPTAGIYKVSGTSPTVSNCILWNNDSNDLVGCTATYSCIEDCNDANGVGNICGDPNDPLFVDDVNDNYHIEPNSPCIDAGDPNGTYYGELDIDFEDRVVGDDVDMGGDEYKEE